MNQFTIHGARGTLPVAGRNFSRYGGHTTCFSLKTRQGLIVVDAGTGINALSDNLAKAKTLPPITLLFTHFHLDHVIGLPFFKPLYQPQARITLMADPGRSDDWTRSLKTMIAPPYWPVRLTHCGARLRFRDLPSTGMPLQLYGVRVSWCPVWHPQQCLAYRLDVPGQSIVIATDHECGRRRLDDRFLQFCRGATTLIFDAQYTPRELAAHRGWGHGTWRNAVRIAREAGIEKLVLTHHDRYRTDAQIDALVRAARRYFSRTYAAREGLTL